MIWTALRFAYDGATFTSGYARQTDGETVEDKLIAALRKVGYVDGSWKTGSRTDLGVSASENVAACGFERPHLDGLVPAIQSYLPNGIWMRGAAEIDEAWNPRHHAIRTYEYMAPKNGEDYSRLSAAAAAFVGRHDMSAFAKVEPKRDPIRFIERCSVADDGTSWVFTVASPGFLWNQVRRMVDAMLRVGRGTLEVADLQASLASGTPHATMKSAKPEGLLLASVAYNPPLNWLPTAGELLPHAIAADWRAASTKIRLLRELTES